MNHADNVIDIGRPVAFSIDGRSYETTARRQRALDLLLLAGLDPRVCYLAELRIHRPVPVRYRHSDIIVIRRGARFLSIRDQAGVV
jgi:hypothetical protein